MSDYISDEWNEKKEEWELIGWSNKHPNAKLKLIIRAWPEGQSNLGLKHDEDEKKKKVEETKLKMQQEKERREKEKRL